MGLPAATDAAAAAAARCRVLFCGDIVLDVTALKTCAESYNCYVLTKEGSTLARQFTSLAIPFLTCDVAFVQSHPEMMVVLLSDTTPHLSEPLNNFLRTIATDYLHGRWTFLRLDEFQSWALNKQTHTSRLSSFSSFAARKQQAQKTLEYCLACEKSRLDKLFDPANGKHVLVVGNGGREHALAWKLAQSEHVAHVYVAPGNWGIHGPKLSSVFHLKADDTAGILAFCQSNHPHVYDNAPYPAMDLVVIGPEGPLMNGLTDVLTTAGVPTFGPSAAAAQLEGSKAFSKAFMARHDLPTAPFQVFTSHADAVAYLTAQPSVTDVVIKVSGLAAGKGVVLPQTLAEGLATLEAMMVTQTFGKAGTTVIIEERLDGPEVSLLCFCDGETVIPMPAAQDHKRIYEGDRGLNTGGMGAYAPAPCHTPEMAARTSAIVTCVITALKQEGRPYIGCLYAGFMLSPTRGPQLLEFNVRFGDPETQVLMLLLQADLYEICKACVTSTLSSYGPITWASGSAVTVVAASAGYPLSQNMALGMPLTLPALDMETTAMCFHAGTQHKAQKEEGKEATSSSSLVTSGGRVLAISAFGATLSEATANAYDGISHVHFQGMQVRQDIALQGLLDTYSLASESPTSGPERKHLRVGVLGSTNGTSLQPLLEATLPNIDIVVVVSNVASSGILARATTTRGVDAQFVSAKGKTKDAYETELTTLLRHYEVDLVLCIGYMKILTPSFCHTWHHRLLNVHPSLLPAFAGGMDLDVHAAVLASGVTETGCTVHFVTSDVDAGPIVVQFRCPVLPTDTTTDLKARVQACESEALMHVMQRALVQRLSPVRRVESPQTWTMTTPTTYAAAGVSIDAGNALVERIKPYCKSTRRVGCDADLGGFGGLFDLSAAGYDKDTVLVACTDGVGTKLKVAQVMGTHDTVGEDLVAMCVNDLIVQGAEPLLFLDYYACGALDVDAAAAVVKGIASGCVLSNCGLIGGETAEMPSMYSQGDYDLAGFCIGAVRKPDLLPLPLSVDDVLIGLPSSGLHANGFSLVRHLVATHAIDYHAPCPFGDAEKTLGETLLTPTRIYVAALLPLVQQKCINALAHITGGGLLENIPRVLPSHLTAEVTCHAWELPQVFSWLQTLGQLDTTELARTFNCGVGMVLVVSPSQVSQVMTALHLAEQAPFVMGQLIPRVSVDSAQVVLTTPFKHKSS